METVSRRLGVSIRAPFPGSLFTTLTPDANTTIVGDSAPPSARSIKDNYNAIIRDAKTKAEAQASQPKTQNIKKSGDDDDKGSLVLTTPLSKAKLEDPGSRSGRVRSGNTTKGSKTASAKKRKRLVGSESEEAEMSTDSDDVLVTPSKRVLPNRRTRGNVKVQEKSGLSDDDRVIDDAAKDLGSAGSDAEYDDGTE